MIFKRLLRDCAALARGRSDSRMAGNMDDATYATAAAEESQPDSGDDEEEPQSCQHSYFLG